MFGDRHVKTILDLDFSCCFVAFGVEITRIDP
jgi:hypothetical protein